MEFVETRVGMPLDEFLEESSRQRFELLNGEKVLQMPTGFEHSELMMKLYDALRDFLNSNPLGRAYIETTFILILPDRTEANWVKGSRIPDVMFLSNAKREQFINSPLNVSGRPLAVVPDLTVEIISPTDKYSEVTDKALLYIQDGVRLVWVIDLEHKRIAVFTPDGVTNYVSGDTILSGGDVLPGFEIKLAELFAQ
jgi:Uma2 family endonuclease